MSAANLIFWGSKNVSLPGTTFTVGDKEIEVFTLEDKGAKIHSYEILFVDKATQQNIATYSVNNPRFKEKGFVYDVGPLFDACVADFKRIMGA
jgi:hypothetical protein